MSEASVSCRLLEVDFSGIEALQVAWFARDPAYYRLAKLGPHAHLASHLIGKPADLSWSDGDLRTHYKALKKAHPPVYEKAKRTVHGCFTGDHEVLTRHGWVRFDQYDWIAPIAEWDPIDGSIAFRPPQDRYVRHHRGPMVQLEGTSLSALITPEHGFPVRTSTGNIKRYAAKNLPKANSIPVVGQVGGTHDLPLDEIGLYVAIQADGSIQASGAVTFHMKKPRKIARLDRWLSGYRHTKSVPNRRGEVSYYIPASAVAHITQGFGAQPTDQKAKLFDLSMVLNWSRDCRLAFLDELPHWDGTVARRGCRNYMTTTRHNADVVQAVAHCTGRQALLREKLPPLQGHGYRKRLMYVVSFNRRTEAALESLTRIHHEAYEGLIYCPKTATGYFLVRGKDRVFVSGNTGYGMTPMGMLLMFPEVYKGFKDAQHTQDVYFDFAPAVKAWQWATKIRAHEQGYLGGHSTTPNILDDVNAHPYDYKFYFWAVLTYKPIEDSLVQRGPNGTFRTKRGVPVTFMNGRYYQVIWGEDAKAALSIYPQSTAAGNIKEAMIPLLADRDDPSYIGDAFFGRTPLRAPIHDSLLLEIPNRAWDRVVESVCREMCRPVEEQPLDPTWGYGDYLTIGVEAKAGRNWQAMEEIAIPGMSELGLTGDRSTYFPAEESEEEDVADLRVGIEVA